MSYQDVIDAAVFNRQHDAYYAAEIRSARHDEDVSDLAARIADEVIFAANERANDRRATYAEEIVDNECWTSFVRDLLDDVKAGINPTDTIRRSVSNWATTVAEYEIERGEA